MSIDPLEDMRARQSALVALILNIDQRANDWLKYVVSLEIAAATGAVALLGQETWPLRSVGFGLLFQIVLGLISCVYWAKATDTADLALPGRGPEFWEWSILHEIDDDEVLKKYIEGLNMMQKINKDLNARMAGHFKRARIILLASPVAMAAATFVAAATFGVMSLPKA